MSQDGEQWIVTLEDALEALRLGTITRVKHLPKSVYRQMVTAGLAMYMTRGSDPVLLTGKGLARQRECHAEDMQKVRESGLRSSRNG